MLACQQGNGQIALDLFNLHQAEYEWENEACKASNKTSFESSSFYFHILKSIEECRQNGHGNLANDLAHRLDAFRVNIAEKQQQNREITQLMEHIPSPHLTGAAIDPDFSLIENLDDLISFLNDEPEAQMITTSNNNKNNNNSDANGSANILDQLNAFDKTLANIAQPAGQKSSLYILSQKGAGFSTAANQSQHQQPSIVAAKQPQLVTQVSQSGKQLNNDQDKKMKTLADNIIAAMPHKIKTNSYSISNLAQQQQRIFSGLIQQQQQQQMSENASGPSEWPPSPSSTGRASNYSSNNNRIMLFSKSSSNARGNNGIGSSSNGGLRRNASSFDDNYESGADSAYRSCGGNFGAATVDSAGFSLSNYLKFTLVFFFFEFFMRFSFHKMVYRLIEYKSGIILYQNLYL